MPRKDPNAIQYRTVHIIVNGSDIEVHPRCVELKCGTKEEIEWVIYPSNLEFTVKFNKNGCPFGQTNFTRSDNTSGPITVSPQQVQNDKFYSYWLEVQGHNPIDPGIIIWK